MDLPPMPDYLAALETEYSQYYELSTPGTRADSKYAHLARSLLAQYVTAYPGFNWCSPMVHLTTTVYLMRMQLWATLIALHVDMGHSRSGAMDTRVLLNLFCTWTSPRRSGS